MNFKFRKALVITFIFCLIIIISETILVKAISVVLYAILIAIINHNPSDDF